MRIKNYDISLHKIKGGQTYSIRFIDWIKLISYDVGTQFTFKKPYWYPKIEIDKVNGNPFYKDKKKYKNDKLIICGWLFVYLFYMKTCDKSDKS